MVTATTSVTINPISTDGTISADEANKPLTIQGKVTGKLEPGDTVTVEVNGTEYLAAVNPSDRIFKLILTADEVAALASGEVVVTVRDASGALIIEATQSFTVNKIPPEITTAAEQTVAENQTVVADLTATDDLGGTVTYTITGGADTGRFDVVNGQLAFKEAPNYEAGTTSFSVQVSATDGVYTTSKLLTIHLTNVNEAPTAVALSADTVAENASGAVIGTLSTTDGDADDTFTYSVDDERFEVVNGQLKLKDGVSLNIETASTVDLTVTSKDAGGLSAQQKFTLHVMDVNEAPTAVTLSSSVTSAPENGEAVKVVDITVTDDALGSNDLSLVGDDADLFEIVTTDSGTELWFKGGANYEVKSSYSVQVKATDADTGSVTSDAFTLQITDVNDNAPVITTADTQTVAENTTFVANLTATDEDTVGTSPATFTISGGADADVFTIENGKLVFRDDPDYDTDKHSYLVEVSANDDANTTTKTITVNLTDLNDTDPVITMSATPSVAENTTFVADVTAADKDTVGGPATFSISGGADAGLFTIEDGKLIFKDAQDYEAGKTIFEVEVEADDGANTSTKTITVNLTDVDEAPTRVTLGNPLTSTAENGAAVKVADVTVTDDALGSNELSLVGDDAGLFEIVTTDSGTELWFKGGANHEAKSSYSVAVAVGAIQSVPLTLHITDVNEAPTALTIGTAAVVTENAVAPAGGTVIASVAVADPDTSPAFNSYTYAVTGEQAAKFAVVNGQLVLKSGAALDYETDGSLGLTVTATNTNNPAHVQSQNVTVTVRDVNEAPSNITVSGGAIKEGAAAGTLVASLSGVDQDAGQAFHYTLLDNAGGRFALSGNTILVADGLKLDYEQATAHAVKVQVTDQGGLSYEQIFSIGVLDVASETLWGSAGADALKGGANKDTFYGLGGNDALWGGGGADMLSGGSGSDLLFGGAGRDILRGGTGKDAFVFDSKASKSNADTIKDFNVKHDRFLLENAVITKLGKKGTEANPSKISNSFFTVGDKAQDKNDYLIYNDNTGKLYYDADGSGSKAQVEIATLSKNLKMTYNDFYVI